ncbi:MAG: ABC transporter ATP-binding protein [Halobacteriovoraceae bacterium]|jgi:ABC-type multidrug transport system fused ATPase/permease subunit|nr:ABC transporter ATP-binding protein [Halobacteriovoraceae bacterium]MBT5094204.1 ABC transporter ATP-binding protein [Halobacteriovoraceae bacterium]
MKLPLEKSLGKLTTAQFISYWPFYLGAFICLGLTHWTQSFLPFYAKDLADLVVVGAEEFETGKYFLLALGIIVFRTSSRLLFFGPARYMERNMRVDILKRLESSIPERYQAFSPGQLFQILYTDTEQMRAFVGFGLLQMGNIVIALVVLLPKLYSFNPDLLVALSPIFLGSILFSVIVGSTRSLWRKAMDYQGDVQNYIMESYAGKRTIKNYHAESSFIELFKIHNLKEIVNAYKAGIAVSFSIPLIPLGLGISFIWGAHIIHAADLGPSALILFSGFVFLLLEPLAFLSWIGIVFVSSMASWKRIVELMKALNVRGKKEVYLLEHNEKPFDESTQSYTFNVPFWDENLKVGIPLKEWSVLIGQTGHGKTEVMNHMALVLKKMGEDISYVGQAPYLYNDTLVNNIFLGREPGQEEIVEALNLLNLFELSYLEKDSASLLEMEIGEYGKRLSGGQGKRLALIRSFMSGADILLWDDPFSSVDIILEKTIVDKLRKLETVKNKTFIITSHRLSTVRICDRVIFLKKNEGIIEVGETLQVLKENSGSKTYEYFQNQMV